MKPRYFQIEYSTYRTRLDEALSRGFAGGLSIGALLGMIVGGFACWMAHG